MEHLSIERIVVIVCAKNTFPASFRQKKLKFVNFFELPHCPLSFNFDDLFLQKYLEDPFSYCLAALTTS